MAAEHAPNEWCTTNAVGNAFVSWVEQYGHPSRLSAMPSQPDNVRCTGQWCSVKQSILGSTATTWWCCVSEWTLSSGRWLFPHLLRIWRILKCRGFQGRTNRWLCREVREGLFSSEWLAIPKHCYRKNRWGVTLLELERIFQAHFCCKASCFEMLMGQFQDFLEHGALYTIRYGVPIVALIRRFQECAPCSLVAAGSSLPFLWETWHKLWNYGVLNNPVLLWHGFCVL